MHSQGSMYHMNYWNTEEIIRTASVIFLGIGFLVLMSLSWVAHNVSHGFSNPLLGSMRKTEMGASLSLAWASSRLLLLLRLKTPRPSS